MFDRVFLSGGSGAGGWIGRLSSSGEEEPNGIALDSDKNIYIGGYTNNPSSPYGYAIIKLDNLGVIQWQRKLSRSGINSFGLGLSIDSSNNIYVAGHSPLNTYTQSGVLAKYNSSGTLQWQRGLNPSSGNIYLVKIGFDSSGNVYSCGNGAWTGNTSYDTGIYVKYNSSGTYQSVTNLKVYTNDQARSDSMQSIKVDSSGNIYTTGYTQDYRPPNYFPSRFPNTWTFIVTAKYDSANNLIWLKKLLSGPNGYGHDIAIASSGNIYVAASTGYDARQCLLLKYNSSGVLQWQKELGTPSTSQGFQYIAVDASENVYCAGYSNVSGDYDAIVVKYNSSGTLQWQRRLGSSGSANYAKGISLDSDGNIYINASLYVSNGEMLVAKLPSDGSGTGTYSVNGASITYAATTMTDSTPSYTHDPAASSAGGNLSTTGSATSDLVDSALTLTSAVTQL